MPFTLTAIVLLASTALPGWEFDSAEALTAWTPNAQLEEVRVEEGVVHARAVDWDPFFTCSGLEIPARPWQCVTLRIRATCPGQGELFWTGKAAGKYGGFSPQKRTSFLVPGGEWSEVALYPGWHGEGVIRKLRLDLYEGAEFAIDWIRVDEWGEDLEPLSDGYLWSFSGEQLPFGWQHQPGQAEYFSPPLDLPLGPRGWVVVKLSAKHSTDAKVLWCDPARPGLQSESFSVAAGGPRYYNVEVQSHPGWGTRRARCGWYVPGAAEAELQSVAIAGAPGGPPDIVVEYFGFENGINRDSRECTVLAQLTNRGGRAAKLQDVKLDLAKGLEWRSGPAGSGLGTLAHNQHETVRWSVRAAYPGTYNATLTCEGPGAPPPTGTTLKVLPYLDLPPQPYVPEPEPVESTVDVCAYYFPGWGSEAAWEPIRNMAPVRKPVLGYYDESKAEVVDWQIKWAVENGITCFLVDWYWVDGHEHLRHWFDAYRKAEYRDRLDVAIMWANHNPPGTHSREDWRSVTREWLDKYFTLDTYYHVGGCPAVFLWSPQNIRNDLGGTEEVRAAFDESQEMARAAGFEGITFIAMHGHDSESQAKRLLEEGYAGATNYHEWGEAPARGDTPRRMRFSDVVETAPDTWEKRNAICGPLTYYPVVDTGWDARPWHGEDARVIAGRTPERFGTLLRAARSFADGHAKPFVVLGPLNEWGEGSYIEPCTEFGFAMYNEVRRVFAAGNETTWPQNIAPADVGLGPYDFPRRPATDAWQFHGDTDGWAPMMGVSGFGVRGSLLHFTTSTNDPAVHVAVRGLPASEYGKLQMRLRLVGELPEGAHARLFWSISGSATHPAASITFPLERDGAFHTYTLDMAANPRWRGRITRLRFDPCSAPEVEVFLDKVVLIRTQ